MRMALSGVTHGPPLIDHPGQFCILKESPRRWHSSSANFIRSTHFSLRHGMDSATPGQSPPPACPWKSCMPPIPASAIAAMSAASPSFDAFPPIM